MRLSLSLQIGWAQVPAENLKRGNPRSQNPDQTLGEHNPFSHVLLSIPQTIVMETALNLRKLHAFLCSEILILTSLKIRCLCWSRILPQCFPHTVSQPHLRIFSIKIQHQQKAIEVANIRNIWYRNIDFVCIYAVFTFSDAPSLNLIKFNKIGQISRSICDYTLDLLKVS